MEASGKKLQKHRKVGVKHPVVMGKTMLG